MDETQKFLFITCQVGAERALKDELARTRREFRFAFSRPGFLTFKLPPRLDLPDDFRLRAVFARSYGFSIGKASVASDADGAAASSEAATADDHRESLAHEVWRVAPTMDYQRIHVWSRDASEPGQHGYEPGMTDEAILLHAALRKHCPRPDKLETEELDCEHMDSTDRLPVDVEPTVVSPFREPARAGQLVLDCIIIDPGVCWVGCHRAGSFSSRWPGGIVPITLPDDAVSRAWLKMEEAIRWSRLPLQADQHCVEIGSAPGGASQALLARGLLVTGVDPAEMSPVVLANPRFTHIRRRAMQVRRREFRKMRWLTADMNVAPKYTLDAVEAIVTHADVNIRGMILTLKLTDWGLARQIPEWLDRVRSWGYQVVRARQLLHNRREICVAAMQQADRRPSRKQKR